MFDYHTFQPAPSSVNFDAHDEAELLSRLLADDAAAWREFNQRYSRLIFRCITKVLGRFSGVVAPDDTREIYSTLCVQLLARDKHKLRSFDPERGNKLSTWLGMLATHAAYDFLRGRKRDPKTEEMTAAETLANDIPSPHDVCVFREQAERVADLLDEFSDKDREFMLLYFGEGLEPEVIAERMGISVKTVYSKKHKIRSKLETLLERRRLAA